MKGSFGLVGGTRNQWVHLGELLVDVRSHWGKHFHQEIKLGLLGCDLIWLNEKSQIFFHFPLVTAEQTVVHSLNALFISSEMAPMETFLKRGKVVLSFFSSAPNELWKKGGKKWNE